MRSTLLSAALVCACGSAPSVDPAAPDGASPPRTTECDTHGQACTRYGIAGTCIDQRCVLPSGSCNYDIDCDDGNACTDTRCDKGTCASYLTQGSCHLGDGAGVCISGECVAAPPSQCATSADCGAPNDGQCWAWVCTAGACVNTSNVDGGACRAPSGREGTCHTGLCSVDLTGDGRNSTVCRTLYDPWWGLTYRDCDPGLKYRLSGDALTDAAHTIEKDIAKTLHYDVAVRLVPIADGGYNIVVHNLNDRHTVKGLIDPSFVAFSIANATARSSWRSRQAQIWVTPYSEGWSIPTSGSRAAIRKGRAASGLGLFGVVDIDAYRGYLEKAFASLPAAQALPGTVALDVVPAAAPAAAAAP